jgi:hypothetical protein
MKGTVVGVVGAVWAVCWFSIAALLHFRLAGELEAVGKAVPWSRIASGDVEEAYVAHCAERGVDPGPKLTRIVGCALVGIPGWILIIISILY